MPPYPMTDTAAFRPPRYSALGALAVLLTIAACGGGSEGSPAPVTIDQTPATSDPSVPDTIAPVAPLVMDGGALYRGLPNASVLQGPVIGDGMLANADVARQIPLEFDGLGNGLRVRSVHVVTTRPEGTGDILAIVENVSNRTHCNVRARTFELFEQDGSSRGVRTSDLVPAGFSLEGGAGRGIDDNGREDFRHDCIPPGAVVYGYGRFSAANPERVASVRISGLESRTDYATSVPGVVALDYSVRGSDIDVRVVNNGDRTVSVRFVELVPLDDDGSPLARLSGFGGDAEPLTPGAEAMVTVFGSAFLGQVSTVHAIVVGVALDP